MAQTTSVLWSAVQGLGEDAKAQARQNIGAAAEQTVNDHTTEIGQIKDDVAGIESSLTNKKDKQSTKEFNGSSTQTVKKITQNDNGELSVEFEDIDLPKKVAVNLNQDFTVEEMATARNNIGAASTEVTNTLNGAVSNLDNRLQGLEQQLAQDEFELVHQLLPYVITNTSLLDKESVADYKEYVGNIGFTTESGGNMSICAFNANEQLIYEHQCVNITGSEVGKTNFVPFTFKENGNERISYIGIKGSSNSNANITHLFYVGKKE